MMHYALRAVAKVKRTSLSKTTVSSKHQVTIARAAFEQAGLKAGDTLAVRAVGRGQIMLTSVDALVAKHCGRLRSGGRLGRSVRAVHAEWE
jgi:bifunctional DNA-binding transcriptional regulator/antitoxin component of YhaV-PrlF toxin-antitoxin module